MTRYLFPVLDTEVCALCGTCETTCIYHVFAVDERQSKVFIDEGKCWSCGFCVGICPAGAIEL
ncbi:MAG: 4Fe-4S binding protein [Desulfobacterales bacterium]|nr:4Fe-4S binding protein [Desulfobacterales bacterium]